MSKYGLHRGKLKDWLPKRDAEFLQMWLNKFFSRIKDPQERSERAQELVINKVMETIGSSMKPNKADPKLVRAFKRDVRKNHSGKVISFASDIDQDESDSDLTLTIKIADGVTDDMLGPMSEEEGKKWLS